MDPVTIAVLVTIGCGLFLAGCASQEKENDELSFEWQPIPEDQYEEHLRRDEDNSPAGNNMQSKCTCSEGNITTLKSTSGYDAQGGIMGTDVDINFINFKKCDTSIDGICKPEIDGEMWKCADESHVTNEHHQVTCDAFMFCRYGVGIVYITDNGQIQGKEYLGNYVVETVTGARLILDSNLNPQGIPLYSGRTLNGNYQYISLNGDSRATYSGIAITCDNAFKAGGNYSYIHPLVTLERYRDNFQKLEALGLNNKNVNYDYHGSFSSGYNRFSTADNRIEVAMRKGILCIDGEDFTDTLAGKYIDVELGDGTILACIVGDAKGDESGSSSDNIFHYDDSFMELMGIDNDNAKMQGSENADKADILHGEDVIGIYVYEEKRLYDTNNGEYTYYFSDYYGDMNANESN